MNEGISLSEMRSFTLVRAASDVIPTISRAESMVSRPACREVIFTDRQRPL